MTNNHLTDQRLSEIAEDGFLEHGDAKKLALELQEHRKAVALHFQRGYDDGHSRGLTCGKLYKTDDQMRQHRAECVTGYKAELRGEESDD